MSNRRAKIFEFDNLLKFPTFNRKINFGKNSAAIEFKNSTSPLIISGSNSGLNISGSSISVDASTIDNSIGTARGVHFKNKKFNLFALTNNSIEYVNNELWGNLGVTVLIKNHKKQDTEKPANYGVPTTPDILVTKLGANRPLLDNIHWRCESSRAKEQGQILSLSEI